MTNIRSVLSNPKLSLEVIYSEYFLTVSKKYIAYSKTCSFTHKGVFFFYSESSVWSIDDVRSRGGVSYKKLIAAR